MPTTTDSNLEKLTFSHKPSNSEFILEIIKRMDAPVSSHLLRHLSGLDNKQLHRILKDLQKRKKIKKSTTSELTSFWSYEG